MADDDLENPSEPLEPSDPAIKGFVPPPPPQAAGGQRHSADRLTLPAGRSLCSLSRP